MDGTRDTSLDGAAARIEALCRSWLAYAGDGASVGVALARASQRQLEDTLFSSDRMASAMLELQRTLGEGPALAVLRECGPVFVTDLRDGDERRSWVVFDQEAQQAGVRSYYAIPLQIGAVILGVLTAHTMTPAPHSGNNLAGLLALGDELSVALLNLGAGESAVQRDGVALLGANAAVIHQASGMVMVQTRETIENALLTLQSYAYGAGRPLLDVAGDVVNRRIRFDDLPGTDVTSWSD